jgi:hypothetical protein
MKRLALKRMSAFGIAVLLFGTPGLVMAQRAPSYEPGGTQTYLDGIQRPGVEARILTVSLFSYAQGFMWANAAMEVQGLPQLYCQPGGLVITGEQAADIITRFVRRNPQYAQNPVGHTLLMAFRETFPC